MKFFRNVKNFVAEKKVDSLVKETATTIREVFNTYADMGEMTATALELTYEENKKPIAKLAVLAEEASTEIEKLGIPTEGELKKVLNEKGIDIDKRSEKVVNAIEAIAALFASEDTEE